MTKKWPFFVPALHPPMKTAFSGSIKSPENLENLTPPLPSRRIFQTDSGENRRKMAFCDTVFFGLPARMRILQFGAFSCILPCFAG